MATPLSFKNLRKQDPIKQNEVIPEQNEELTFEVTADDMREAYEAAEAITQKPQKKPQISMRKPPVGTPVPKDPLEWEPTIIDQIYEAYKTEWFQKQDPDTIQATRIKFRKDPDASKMNFYQYVGTHGLTDGTRYASFDEFLTKSTGANISSPNT